MPSSIWVPRSLGMTGSYADDVAEIAESIGRPFYPHQLEAVEAFTAHDKFGRFLTIEAVIEGPRQSIGKTGGVVLPVILWTLLTERTHAIWTAQLLDTSGKTFLDLVHPQTGLVTNNEWLARRVSSISLENGYEGISFRNGSQLDFRARSGRRSRGLTAATVVVDEALYWTQEQAGALLPVLSTKSKFGNARAYYASSSAKKESGVLRNFRKRAAAQDPTLTHVGFWAPGSWAEPGCQQPDCQHELTAVGCSLDNEKLWFEANPTLGGVVSYAFMRTMRRTLDPLEFGREFLGWQEEGDSPVDQFAWSGLTDVRSKPVTAPLVIGVDVSSRATHSSVVAAGWRSDGLMHVEVLAYRAGTDWLESFLTPLQNAGAQIWTLGGTAPVVSVSSEWTSVRCDRADAAVYAASCATLQRRVDNSGLKHLGDPILTRALSAAARRDVGDGAFVLSRKSSSGDISPAIACCLAVHALSSNPPIDVWGFQE